MVIKKSNERLFIDEGKHHKLSQKCDNFHHKFLETCHNL